MKRICGYYFLFLAGSMLFACEDVVHPTLESAVPVLAVDAWVNNMGGKQTIILTQSQTYFDNTVPPGASGAVVTVTDSDGKVYLFPEDDKRTGYYVWTPVGSEVFGTVGKNYRLSMLYNGETFESFAYMGRVPAIDSITFDTSKRIGSSDSITRAEFWSTDPLGPGDAYWIRSRKNGILLNKPAELNIAWDAGFSEGGLTDGVVFITPIRRSINSNDQDSNGRTINPIVAGDSINVQIHSITKAAFSYLNQVRIQTDRPGGFQELFSTPLANVPTNILNVNPAGSSVLGFFNVAAVSSAGSRFKKK
jgi:hypothetical protein